jgi:hypothetical protein
MKTKFIKCNDENGKEIIIRADTICAIKQNTYHSCINGVIKSDWTAKVVLIGGSEICLSTSYGSIIAEWTEASLYE